MDDQQDDRGGVMHSLVRFLDLFGYVIERLRGAIIDPAVFLTERCMQFSRTLVKPKTGQGDENPHLSKEEDPKYCLHSSGLSFFDTFACINGIPAYFLSQDGIKSSCEAITPSSSVEKRQSMLKHSKRVRVPGTSESSSQLQDENSIAACCFSRDSTRFTICYLSGQVSIWDVNHGDLLEDEMLKDALVSSVSFLDTSNTILLICTQEYTCWKLEFETNGSNLTKICDREILSIINGQIFSQRSTFYKNGTTLVFSSIMNTEEGRILHIAMVDIIANPTNIKAFRVFSISIDQNYVISKETLSLDKKGILVGLMDQALEDSYCLLWPDYDEDPTIYKTLDKGTIGSWSSDNKHAVTWIMTDKLNSDADDENSAFIWNVEEMRENSKNDDYSFKPKKITNPFGDKVFWCQIVQNMDKNDRLVMGISGASSRFLFWDIKTNTHTHTIETNISTREMILCNSESWIESYVFQRSVKGLSPMNFNEDRRMFGAALGLPSEILMWDSHLGIEVLRVSSKDLEANQFKGGIDLMASPSCTKFAVIGSNKVIVFCPSAPSINEQRPRSCVETQMVQMDNLYTNQDNSSSFKMCFSGDGDSLGVLCIGLPKMKVWNLPQGISCTIESAHNEEGGKIQDFCLSNNGKYVVISIRKCIKIMDCETDEMAKVIGKISIDLKVVSMGINKDASELVLCMKDGSIHCYKLSHEDVHSNDEATPATSNIHDFAGHRMSLVERFKSWFKRPLVDLNERFIDDNERRDQIEFEHINLHIHSSTRLLSYGTNVLAKELEEASFQVSSRFKDVIRISASQGVEAWDLETKMKMFGPFKEISSIKRKARTYSRVSSITEQMSNELESKKGDLLSGTDIDLSKRTTLVQSSKDNIIVAGTTSSQGVIQRRNQRVFDVEYEEGKHEDSRSIYVINCKEARYKRKLKGRNLEPEKGLAISHDGRYIACFAGDNASKIVVWNVYASNQLLPDYNFLSLTLPHGINHKEGIKQDILPLIEEFGRNFFMFRHPSGMSFLNEAICYFNSYLLRAILQYALKKKIKVSFLVSKKSQVWDPISSSLIVNEEHMVKRSPKTLHVMLKYLLKRVTHEVEVERILTRSLVPILQHYPTIFIHTIRDSRLLAPGHEIEVPEQVLEGRKFIASTSNALNLSEKEAREFWKEELRKDHPNTETSPTIMATVSTLPYKDATKIACEGLLHNLLINKARYSVFGAFLMQVIVDFKWRKYGQRVMLHEAAHHIALLATYMVYCFILCIDGAYKMDRHQGIEENSYATQIALYICMVLAVPCFYRELRQCTLYARKDGWCGFFSWLGSAWNGMEVLSYLIIVVFIPLAEFYFFREGRKSIILSSIVALESLLLWCRVLYYARTMPRIGMFVTVISSVVSAVLPFLLIAFCVMFGFAVAFHVLYRHVGATLMDGGDDSELEELRSLRKSFGTFGRTLFTVFGFTFGEFDLDEIYHAPAGSIATILFVLYMVTVSTTLLNMLIAVMTKEFNGIRGRERIRFIQARAMAIGDNESMMSSKGRMKINSEIGKYLHIMTPSFGHARLFRGLRRSTVPTMDEMAKTIKTHIRQELVRSRKRHGQSSTQALDTPLPLQATNTTSQSQSGIFRQSPFTNVPLVETASSEENWYESESTDSEYSDGYSEEDAD